MNHTSANISINNSIEKHDFSILTVMLVFAYMHSSSIRNSSSSSSSSSSRSKAMLVITVVVIRIIVLLLDRSTNE